MHILYILIYTVYAQFCQEFSAAIKKNCFLLPEYCRIVVVEGVLYMDYDIIITGAGPGGIFALYELVNLDKNLRIAVFEAGHSLEKRKCPIGNGKVTSCIHCKSCSIMSGFGGAGAFSDGKYNKPVWWYPL